MPMFHPARSANNRETRAKEQNSGGYDRDLDSCITAVGPDAAHEGRTQDTLRVIMASDPPRPKRKTGERGCARVSANLRSLSAGRCGTAVCFFRFFF